MEFSTKNDSWQVYKDLENFSWPRGVFVGNSGVFLGWFRGVSGVDLPRKKGMYTYP